MVGNQKNIPLLINFFIVWCFVTHLGQSDQTNVSSWYKTQIIDTVIPPYSDAYTTLNDKIVQKLLTINTDSDETTIRTLVDSLVCASRKAQNKLSVATKASEHIANSLNEQITQVTLSITNQEHKIRESQEAVDQANINIQHTQQQVTLAEQAVRDKQHALNAAEHDVNAAQKAVNDARLCTGKRDFGRWWRKHVEKFVVNVVHHTVIRSICSVINGRGIDNAKQRRGLAQHNLHEAHQRLAQHKQNLAHQHAQHATAQTKLNEATSQRNILTTQLHEKQAKQRVIALLIRQFQGVAIHLKHVLDSSTTPEYTISQLIDFELVIVPLNAIYQEMIKNNVMVPFTFKISAEMTLQVLKNIKVLSDKIPKASLNEIIVKDIDINCA